MTTAAPALSPPRPGAAARRAGAPRPGLRSLPRPAPSGRLGLVWAAATAGAVAGGRWSLAAWLAMGGLAAVAAVVRLWVDRDRERERQRARSWSGPAGPGPTTPAGRARPAPAGALVGALVVPVAAAGGTAPFAGALCAALVLAVVPRRARLWAALRAAAARRSVEPADAAAVAGVELVAFGLCAGSLVLLERQSVTLLAALLALVCCHDASRYLVGTGAPAAWEGAVAGVAAVGSATLAVAVLQPSPVTAGYAWVLALVVAAGGVAGRRLSLLIVPSGAAVPGAWRRLDTLLVAAPVWLLVVAFGHL